MVSCRPASFTAAPAAVAAAPVAAAPAVENRPAAAALAAK